MDRFDVMALLGLVILAAGAGMVYAPAGLIVFGLGLMGMGILGAAGQRRAGKP